MSTPAQVETYFDPEDDLEGQVAEEIARAKRSVWIQAYKFSSEPIVETILRLKQANPDLDVRLSLDPKEALSKRDKKQGRLSDAIAGAGGEVRFVSDADKSHSKFIIVDSEVVITGSFNFKRHAERVQRDNMVVIRSRDVAQTYATRFLETLTSDQVVAKGQADAPRSPETPPAAPTASRRWGSGLLVAGRTLLVGFGAVLVLLLGTVGLDRFEQVLEADAELEFSGVVEAMPPDGLVGTWQIGGRTVQVTESTEIERTSSLPAIGTRVAVEATVLADQSIRATEIELGDD